MNRVLALLPIVLIAAAPATQPRVVFEDHFNALPADGWSWLREDAKGWRVKDGALEIRAEQGAAHTVNNALVRTAPDRSTGTYAIEVTITNLARPTNQFEQAGITWYTNGTPVFKLMKELVDGKLMIVPGRQPIDAQTVQLRLIVSADSFTAQFRPDGKGDYQTAATGKLPPPGKDQVSIQCYHGPSKEEHWVRFDDFRIMRLK